MPLRDKDNYYYKPAADRYSPRHHNVARALGRENRYGRGQLARLTHRGSRPPSLPPVHRHQQPPRPRPASPTGLSVHYLSVTVARQIRPQRCSRTVSMSRVRSCDPFVGHSEPVYLVYKAGRTDGRSCSTSFSSTSQTPVALAAKIISETPAAEAEFPAELERSNFACFPARAKPKTLSWSSQS